MRRMILAIVKLVLVRLVWNGMTRRLQGKATKVFNMRNLFGESAATWWRMRKLK
jgi:hypothetical protein